MDGDQNPNQSRNGGSNFAQKLMQKMGYQEGKGLGLREQGITEPILGEGSTGKLGLGHGDRKHAINDPNVEWDHSVEQKTVEEFPTFIECPEEVRTFIKTHLNHTWIVKDEPLTTLRDSVDYCDPDLVNEVIDAKAVFDNLETRVLNEARRRANPYETVMGGIFQNRAAMKTANLDRVFDWKLSREFDTENRLAKNPIDPDVEAWNASRDDDIFYFADVCAGPGGFSEYMIWRKAFYNVKGFGFTLRGGDDFKLQNFKAGSPTFFETFYGTNKNGDVTNPENLKSLEEYVKKRTNGEGCHLVMCDGGFSVDGKEEIQEVLSKRIYLCQFIAGISLLRVGDGSPESGGNYLCKLFDVFTPFSAGLIYLMYSAFEKISLHKPNTSRPANSERYIFCENLTKFGATVIKNYLVHINDSLDKMDKEVTTISEIFPYDEIVRNTEFFNYFKNNNEEFARKQVLYLNKYKEFSKNKGIFDSEQENLRENCLKYWEIPDKQRSKEDQQQPAMLALKPLIQRNEFAYEFCPPFSLQGPEWKQRDKQVRNRELCSVLMPDYKAPILLVSNEKGNAYLFRAENQSQLLEDLRLPPRTLLLVQEMTIFETVGREIRPYEAYSKMLFIVDASRINNDDISKLDYQSRLSAIRKFCYAANRGIESVETDFSVPIQVNTGNKRRNNQMAQKSDKKARSYYLHCAESIELDDLDHYFKKMRVSFYGLKCTQVAVRDFKFEDGLSAEDKILSFPCQAVRFVRRYKDNYMLCWSNSNRKLFLFDTSTGVSYFESHQDAIPSFFDHFPVPRKDQHVRPNLTWMWSWQMDAKNNYGPNEIINNDEFSEKLTAKSLCNAIQKRQSEYNGETMTYELL